MSGMFLIHDNGDLVEMREAPYDSEDLLQSLIEKFPNLLAGEQIDASSHAETLATRVQRDFRGG